MPKRHSSDSDDSDAKRVKRRKKEKKEKKEKKSKKDKDRKRKHHSTSSSSSSSDSTSDSSSSDSDSDSGGVPREDLAASHQIVAQLLQLFPQQVDDLKQMFENIDKSELINIRDVSDVRVKNAFTELFKHMRVMPFQAGYRKTAFTPKLCREFRSHLKTAGSAASAQRKAEKKQQKALKKEQRRQERKARHAARHTVTVAGPFRPSETQLSLPAPAVIDDDARHLIEDEPDTEVSPEVYDEFGPVLLKPGQVAYTVPEPINMIRVRKSDNPDDASKRRESWMTELPPDVTLGISAGTQSRSFASRTIETRTDRDAAAWTDTPAERQRKAEAARAAAVQRSIQMQLTGQSNTDKTIKTTKTNEKSASDSVATSGGKSLAELHAQKVMEEKLAKRAEIDPRFSHMNPALLAPEWNRDKEFQSVNLDAKPKQNSMLNQASALSDRFASAGTKTSFL